MIEDADGRPTEEFARNIRLLTVIYCYITIFFIYCTSLLLKLCRKLSSPIHAVTLAQALLGILVGVVFILYAFLRLSCSVTLRINMALIGISCMLLTLVISLQVLYIYPKSRSMRLLMGLYFFVYAAFIIYVGITQEPVQEGIHCSYAFPFTIPLTKLCIDLFGNIVLGGAVIRGIRGIALKEGGTFWHRMIVERIHHIVCILICNSATAVLLITDVAGQLGYFLYFVDWAVPCAILTYHLHNAKERRVQRGRGDNDDYPNDRASYYADSMPLTQLGDAPPL